MRTIQNNEVKVIHVLRETFGEEVVLTEGSEESAVFRIVAEFSFRGKSYAVLNSSGGSSEQEPELFQITTNDEGLPELVTIEDDEEWETVAELYDEMAYPISSE